jgi:YLP motif-containing protein 1
VFATVASIFKRPGRLKRPPRIFIILRGLPGAGKSRVARTLRDIEVANGGEAPRVLSLDDYFLQVRFLFGFVKFVTIHDSDNLYAK